MVNYSGAGLDRVFAALADPTRRAMVARLARARDLSVGALAKPHAMSLPAVLKHVAVLAEAGVLERRKIGRTVLCRLKPRGLEDAGSWLARHEAFWSARLDALGRLVEDGES